MNNDHKMFAPAADRNKEAILDVLKSYIKRGAKVLEVASGTGQHTAFLASHLTTCLWQPSEFKRENFPSIEAWSEEAQLSNVLKPIFFDAGSTDDDDKPSYDFIFNANMIHISPWAVCQGLLRRTSALLNSAGLLAIYGPFFREDSQTAASNLAFDQSLRQRDPEWGIRKLEDVQQQAEKNGLRFIGFHEMPANNLIVIFQK